MHNIVAIKKLICGFKHTRKIYSLEYHLIFATINIRRCLESVTPNRELRGPLSLTCWTNMKMILSRESRLFFNKAQKYKCVLILEKGGNGQNSSKNSSGLPRY